MAITATTLFTTRRRFLKGTGAALAASATGGLCLPALAQALFFFHPLLWPAQREWRLAQEIALLVRRALDDLGVAAADVVLGGGMLTRGEGLLHDEVVARLPEGARPVVLRDPPVLGAALAALDAAATTSDAGNRLRAAFREHTDLANVRAG